VDNDIFRETYHSVNERRCLYEKGVLTNQCLCSRAKRFCIAEREGVQCTSPSGQARCDELLGLLRENSRFALKSAEVFAPLAHGRAMRVQIGGLRGVYRALHDDEAPPTPIPDVFSLIEAAQNRFLGLAGLPFGEIVKEVAAFRGRQPRSRRHR